MPEKFSHDDQKITWIPVRQLSVVWTQSQRPFIAARAKKIADNFDPDRFDPIKVTMPNGAGIYHIVEGQHRKGAVQLLWGEEEKAPCIVIEAEDPAAAARVFAGINGTRWKVDPVSMFKANVTAEERREVAINKIVEHCDYRVGATREDSSRYISAVSALTAVYDSAGPTILKAVLEILSATWNNDPQKTNGSLIRGYGQFLNEFGLSHINLGNLKSAVAGKWTPGSLLHQAKGDQDTYGGSTAEAVSRLLLVTYNKGVKQDKKLKRKNEE